MMRRAIIAIALTVGLGVLLMLGCGGGSSSMSPTSNVSTGSVVALGTDAPLCNVFSVSVTIMGITLTPQNGGTPVSILGSGQSLTIDFLRLMEFNTMLNLASVPVGLYSQMTLTLSNAQITVLDVTQTPPQPVSIPTTLQNATVSINLDPALTVNSNGTTSLLVDFHLFRSLLSLTTQATIDPVMTVARVSPSSEDGLGRLDDLHGIVQSVSTTSTDPAFTGSFTLQTQGGTGPVLTVNTTSNTNFEDVSGLSGLAQGSFVEVDAAVDTSGHIVAKEVELEGTVQGQGKAAFEGIIIDVQRDTNGNATQFTLFVREEFPDVSASIPLRSALTVDVGGSTNFLILRPGINEANLTLGLTTLGVGQAIVARGSYTTGSPNGSLMADGVALHPQAIRGAFQALLQPEGSDHKTGGFSLVPCSPIFKGMPIQVFTFGDTTFYGVSDLDGLSSMTPVHAKGLLFYGPASTTINGIATAPQTLLMEAKTVRQRAMGD
ncbi:MAG: DUF4382 domain-containing protein [Terriglobia bacterium]